MRIAFLLLLAVTVFGQERYANMPSEAVPYRGFTKPYKQWYLSPDTLEYNGAAREHGTNAFLNSETVNLGFLGPLESGPEVSYGKAMLHGAQMAVDEANASGGYLAPDGRRRLYKLMIHNDSAQWGASSTEIVKMDFDEHVLAVLGSVDAASTHIMLRVTLKLEIPIVDTATTDPTVTETRIPWLIHNFPDDRQQGYALADCVFKQHNLQRIGVLRTESRYARMGVRKFADEAQRLGHTPVLEVKFDRGDKDFSTQLRMLKNARVQGIVIWAEAGDAGMILKQMRGLGMKQPVFGPSRLAYRELIEVAGAAAEGVTTAVAIDPTRSDAKWQAFVTQYRKKYEMEPDAYAAYGFDGMSMMIKAVAKAGLNRGLIMDALREYGAHTYEGVAGQAKFDYTLNNISAVRLARVENGDAESCRCRASGLRSRISSHSLGTETDGSPEDRGRERHADDVQPGLVVAVLGRAPEAPDHLEARLADLARARLDPSPRGCWFLTRTRLWSRRTSSMFRIRVSASTRSNGLFRKSRAPRSSA